VANPSKAKGTGYESKLVPLLREIWPDCERSSAGKESCDFHATGEWTVEAKKRSRWDIPEWVRRIRKVSVFDQWVIFVEPGNLTTGRAVGEIAVMDADMARTLLERYERWADGAGD
jgi:hypothetical protein